MAKPLNRPQRGFHITKEGLERFTFTLKALKRGISPEALGLPEVELFPCAASDAFGTATRAGDSFRGFAQQEGYLSRSDLAKARILIPQWQEFARAEPNSLLSAGWKLGDAFEALKAIEPEAKADHRVLGRVYREVSGLRCSATHIHVLRALLETLRERGTHDYVLQHVASTIRGLENMGDIVLDPSEPWDLPRDVLWRRYGFKIKPRG